MNALATIIITVVGAGVALAGLVMYRAEQRRTRDVQLAAAAGN